MIRKAIKISVISVIIFFSFSIHTSFADSLGQSVIFNVDSNYDSAGRNQISATLRYVGDKDYFYIEDNWWNLLGNYKQNQVQEIISNLAKEFDEIIYPKLTQFFGGVWDPGIDGDSRITVLISNLQDNAGGYFDSCHEYSRSQCGHSNEREMIHVNADFIFDSKMNAFIAHELQHLINWNQKERISGLGEDIWLNEMRSEYAPGFLGYNDPYSESTLEMRVKNFLDNLSNPLGEWKNESGDYGVIALLGQYLADQFGANIFSLLSKNNLTGIVSINKALQEAGYTENFDEIFNNWSLSNYFNNLAIGKGGKYGYTNPDLKRIQISPTLNSFYSYGSVSFIEAVKDWSPRWYLLENKLSSVDNSIALKIEFKSSNPNANFKVPYMITYKDGTYEFGLVNLVNQSGAAYAFNFANDVKSVLIAPANHFKTSNFTNNDSSAMFTLQASTVIVNQPVISVISPSKGPLSGGNSVLIKGANFQKGIEVYFGGAKSSNVSFVNETMLNAIVPQHEAGPVNVWIKNIDGKSSIFAQGYEYSQGAVVDGSLIRAKGDYKVYIIKGNYKRHILDSKIFSFYGHFGWASIIEVSPEERDFYKESALVRADGDPRVYEVNGDKTKHWLNITAEQFINSGRNWDGVFIINKQERDFYKTGSNVLFK